MSLEVLLYHLNLLVLLSGTDPVVGVSDAAAAGTSPQVELSPFGTLITVITWATLIGINLWCFRKALMHKPDQDSVA
ncbi:MAG: hypothetical protein COA70_09920 [Planctomycetota bacterium]|nr:MAG: hypothetical protein COA70_09920 [Planctomycetota bacterium]